MNTIVSRVVRAVVTCGLVAAIAVSGCSALHIQKGYKAEKDVNKEMAAYKPVPSENHDKTKEGTKQEDFINREILSLKTDYPDALGWITVPFTGIDYPFVQTSDNSHYLSLDIDGNYSIAGTIFMDCDSSADFSDFNTILYGHHMKNGTMFGPLAMFGNREFFETNTNGTVFLENKTFSVDFFAYIIAHAEDLSVYDSPVDRDLKITFLDYLREKARYYREIGIGPDDQIITLSTCAYEFKDARMLLLGKLTQIQ